MRKPNRLHAAPLRSLHASYGDDGQVASAKNTTQLNKKKKVMLLYKQYDEAR